MQRTIGILLLDCWRMVSSASDCCGKLAGEAVQRGVALHVRSEEADRLQVMACGEP
jgi:hypothetical protein